MRRQHVQQLGSAAVAIAQDRHAACGFCPASSLPYRIWDRASPCSGSAVALAHAAATASRSRAGRREPLAPHAHQDHTPAELPLGEGAET